MNAALWVWFMQERLEFQSADLNSKIKALAPHRGLVNDSTYTWFKLK